MDTRELAADLPHLPQSGIVVSGNACNQEKLGLLRERTDFGMLAAGIDPKVGPALFEERAGWVNLNFP